ncbi:MAG: hypothetical protein O2897_06175 [bacterium]|nr:hypothetical protein [bacterium]
MHGIPERPAGHAEIRNEHSAPKETAPRSTEHTSAHDSPDILELPHSAPPPRRSMSN